MDIDWSIIEHHEQKYAYSCIPSAVEMILKLHNKINQDFYALQSIWENTLGSFDNFDNKVYYGFKFQRLFGFDRDENFPFNDFFNKIETELNNDHFVIISLKNNNGFHMYVIYEKVNNEYKAFSKSFEKTIKIDNVKESVVSMKGTDILVYTDIGDE